jgi:hypothetical protein
MPEGAEFIRHEFDEAIAVQRAIVEAERQLATSHPLADAKRELKSAATESERWLARLERAGGRFGATGEAEEVAQGIVRLAQQTLQKAASTGQDSDYYEAHAVLLNAKRKQQDSAGSIVKIARTRKERELATEAVEMQKSTKAAADALAKSLAVFAVEIASEA